MTSESVGVILDVLKAKETKMDTTKLQALNIRLSYTIKLLSTETEPETIQEMLRDIEQLSQNIAAVARLAQK